MLHHYNVIKQYIGFPRLYKITHSDTYIKYSCFIGLAYKIAICNLYRDCLDFSTDHIIRFKLSLKISTKNYSKIYLMKYKRDLLNFPSDITVTAVVALHIGEESLMNTTE